MKAFLLGVVAAVMLSSCTRTVQVVTLRGNNVQPVEKEGLVLDNDSLTLRYNFSSERGTMNVTLLNKLDRPLYVDWKRSSLVIGNTKLDYWQDVSDVNLAMSGVSHGLYSRYLIGSINGTISRSEPVGFMPPKTTLTKTQFILVPDGTVPLDDRKRTVKTQRSRIMDHTKPVTVNSYAFGADQSPLKFRSYLTLATDKDFKDEFHIDTKFWASDVDVLPADEVIGTVVMQYDGSYSISRPFNKPDGFYIKLPL
ncbi:hypothetical protein GCM10027578_09930 [Spirosoma luteolum]